MRRHRLDRLAALTRGAALVGMGTLAAACTKDSPPGVNAPVPDETVHVNAPASATGAAPSATEAPSAAEAPSASASAAPTPSGPPSFRPRIINAPPKGIPPL